MVDFAPPPPMDPLTRPLVGLDYDERTSTVYDQSQELPSETFALWLDRFCHHAGPRRPQAVVDLGCGTGRFAPALAEALGGPVVGVEPSRSMREVAERLRPHPRVRYVEGRAEELPLSDHSCDFLLMFLVLHHVRDRRAAAREAARVLRPGGRLLVRSRFRGEPTPRGWTPYFPKADAVEQASLPTVAETIDLYEGAGLAYSTFERVRTCTCESLRSYAERVRLRVVSALRCLTDEEFAAGLARIEAHAAREKIARPVMQDSDLLVFTLPGRQGALALWPRPCLGPSLRGSTQKPF